MGGVGQESGVEPDEPSEPPVFAPDEMPPAGSEEGADALPVVARMVIEIRSDGTRTVATGAVDDRLTGQQTAVRLRAASLKELAWSLTKLLGGATGLARRAARRVWPGRKALEGKTEPR